ncbi:MAG: zinc ribbon domain-containing protein [Lachnospiraceae bacterium]|nr:zinc ribbon domain-containing protein [Lachnospiraceae bacterium]
MFCTNCGKQVRGDAAFCTSCGMRVYGERNPSKGFTFGTVVISAKAAAVIAASVIGVVLLTASVFAFLGKKYDLSGTYYTQDYFVFDSITFWKDGKVQVNGGLATSGVVGRYKKDETGYYITLSDTADGTFGGGRATLMLADYSVVVIDENTIEVEVIPISALYAWMFTKVKFVR